MIFGNLEKVLENEQSINEAVKENFNSSFQNIQKPTRWSKILTTLSHYGMNYSDQVYKNMMTRLKQGEYIVQNPVFRSLLNIKFPKPIYKQYKQ